MTKDPLSSNKENQGGLLQETNGFPAQNYWVHVRIKKSHPSNGHFREHLWPTLSFSISHYAKVTIYSWECLSSFLLFRNHRYKRYEHVQTVHKHVWHKTFKWKSLICVYSRWSMYINMLKYIYIFLPLFDCTPQTMQYTVYIANIHDRKKIFIYILHIYNIYHTNGLLRNLLWDKFSMIKG